MSEFSLHINGQSVAGDNHFDVINPATADVLTQCPAASEAQVNAAVEAAHNAFSSWKKTSLKERQAYLEKIADKIEARKDELAKLLTQEQGKPIAQATSETGFAITRTRFAAGFTPPKHILKDDDTSYVEVVYKPLGVVAAITPWNFPLSLALGKVAMAILAGNTVVLKPSPYTPLTSLMLGEIMDEVLPPGVVNVISGTDEIGPWLTRHPAIEKYTFTGSGPTGKKIGAIAADRLKAFTLELGGNDPAIVLADVDIEETAQKIFWGAFTNSGQICIAIKRLFVHEDIFVPFVSALVKIAQSIKIGDGLDPETQMGPLNNEQQLKIVSELVEDAKAHGAKIHCGGQRIPGPGYFYEPTIVTDIKEGNRLVDEEQFGPALPVMSFKTTEEAIERANGTDFGLGASVWSGNVDEAKRVALELDSGMTWANCRGGATADAPFGGSKSSGFGREGGIWGFEELVEVQTLVVAK